MIVPTGDGAREARPGSVRSFDETLIFFDLYDLPEASSLVVVVPGFWRDRRHPSMVGLATLLNGLGYAVAVIDLRGHGESGGTYGFNLHEHFDVAAVLDAVSSSRRFSKITLLGFSVGGGIATAAMARHSFPWASLLLISPVAEFAMVMPKINPFTIHRHIAFSQAFQRPRFNWGFARSEKLKGTTEIESVHVPVAMIHMKDDWLIGHGHSLALYEHANEPKELHVIDLPGKYHADRLLAVGGESVKPLIVDFLRRTLG